jgi:hypothetical protein
MSDTPVTDKTQSAIFRVLKNLNRGDEPAHVDIEIAMNEIVRLRKLCEKKTPSCANSNTRISSH